MVTAAGVPRVINKANSVGFLTGKHLANPNGISVWESDAVDPWREHGVWNMVDVKDSTGKVTGQEPVLLDPGYFCSFPRSPDKPMEFFRDCLRPFMVLYISRIRAVMPRALLFAEGDGFGDKEFVWAKNDLGGIVNASHWYDGFTLFTASFNPRFSVDVSSRRPVWKKSYTGDASA